MDVGDKAGLQKFIKQAFDKLTPILKQDILVTMRKTTTRLEKIPSLVEDMEKELAAQKSEFKELCRLLKN